MNKWKVWAYRAALEMIPCMGKPAKCTGDVPRSLPRTLVQIAFAVMVGFALVQLFYRGGSIWPCVIFHSLNNALNAFGVEGTLSPAVEIAVNLALTLVLMGGYALYLQKALPAPKDPAA